jgi:hypothetical protein
VKCYTCLLKGKFPVRVTEDERSNVWFKEEQWLQQINQGVRGAHAAIPFQCEGCWMANLEGRPPALGLDDGYVMCICQANLDTMGSRAISILGSHATAVKQTVANYAQIKKTPTLPARGAMPLADHLGMRIAVEMLFDSLIVKPRLKGETHIQFDTMRRPRATYTLTWESSPMGIGEGSNFATGSMKVMVTLCPTQQRWFGLFLRGAENRMGYVSQRNQPLCEGAMRKLLDAVKVEIEEVEEEWLKREYVKFGAATTLAVCASLWGLEVYLLDLAGLWKYLEIGQDGVLPGDPLKPEADFTNYPYIIVTLIGEFKGELGTKHHLITLASTTLSGIELRGWMEQLLKVQEVEGCLNGPAFGHKDGSVGLMSEYDDLFHFFLGKVQDENPELILPSDDIETNCRFLRTFQRTAEGKARGTQLDSSVQNAMNSWRKIEETKGKRPRFNMVDHYSHARQLVLVTWPYSYVQ